MMDDLVRARQDFDLARSRDQEALKARKAAIASLHDAYLAGGTKAALGRARVERDEAIATALDGGHSQSAVARAMKVTPYTVVQAYRRVRNGRWPGTQDGG